MNKVLVIGDVMLDATINGCAYKISPEAPVPVILNPNIDFKLGGAANVALNCSDLGSAVIIASILGVDETADTIAELVSKKNLESSFVKLSGHISTKKLRIKSGSHQFLRCDYETVVPEDASEDFIEKVIRRTFINECSIMIISDYGKGVVRRPRKLIDAGLSLGMKIIIDPKGTDYTRYAGATMITPNRDEAELEFGPMSQTDFDEKIFAFLCANSVENMCITLGSQGLKNYDQSGKVTLISSEALSVFDVTGAGDSFVAGVAVSLLSNTCIYTALKFGNRVAGVAVTKSGTYSVTQKDL